MSISINAPVPMGVVNKLPIGCTKTQNKAPYTFRVSGGDDNQNVGKMLLLNSIIGGTIAWNQLCNGSSTSVPNGHKYVAYIGGSWSVGASNGTALSTDASTDKVFDITQMFGSTIADYIYTLESGTAGAGVAWLKSYGFFADDNYSYHAATLESVNVSAHVMRDSSDNIIGNYPLDSALTLRGILKLDANNELYYDGDEYASDGTVTRRYSIVDLGTLNWGKQTSNYMNFYSTGISSVVKRPSTVDDSYKIIICSRYSSVPATASNDNYIYINANGQIRIKDTSNAALTVAEFKTLMSGVYLVYELETPTTETADPYEKMQIVSKDGTEQFVDASERDIEMPVQHETVYPIPTFAEETFDAFPMSVEESGTTQYPMEVTSQNIIVG